MLESCFTLGGWPQLPKCAFESQVDRLLTLDAEANLCRFAALSVAILVTVRTGSDGKISMTFGMNGRMSILLPAVLVFTGVSGF